MGGIQFNEDFNNPNVNQRFNPEKGLTSWLIRKGIVKDKKTANYILIAASVFFFILSFIIGF
jgi:hypothetical protein